MNTEIPPSAYPPPAQKSSLPVISLVLSLLGCCILPAIASIILALIAINNAKTQNLPRPGAAVAAIVISTLMMLFGVFAIVAGLKADEEREEAATELRSKLAPKLSAATLDEATACDLAKAYFLGVKKETVDALKCDGDLEQGNLPRLANVTMKSGADEETFTFCYAKAHRWYVVATPADGECPSEAPAVPGQKPADEEAFQIQEDSLRDAAARARAAALIDRFNARVEKLKDVINGGHEGEKKCPPFKAETKVSFVDAEVILGEEVRDKGWKMLTHEDWRTAMSDQASAVERAAAIDNISRKGPYVVIFDADGVREWPIAEVGDSYTMGAFDGYLTVVHLADGEVVCDGKLDFESSETVGGGIKLKGMPDKSTRQLIDDDFEDVFEKAATDKVKAMSRGKLKLGLKLLE